ncbi:MAG: SMP-30/gluconolactonase/LRE family protein, partial [Scytonema sp. PMC 1069.18]|nr:SMP-30/gluconolactonase/LRE family protein [Scytonema sp. PMC 1069.18]
MSFTNSSKGYDVKARIVPQDAKLEKVFDGGVRAEGVAVAPDGMVYFSDLTVTYWTGMQAGYLWKYDPKSGTTRIFRSPSGMSDGIKFDAYGRMVVAEGADFGGRRITRTDMKTGKSVILAGLYNGRAFNSPNDLAIDEKGRIYFTDPRYIGHEPIDQLVYGVYRIDPDGSVCRIISDLAKPNGIAVSPNQKILYVSDHDDGLPDFREAAEDMNARRGPMALVAYDLAADGTVKGKKILVDYSPHNGADGFVVDSEGNIFAAVRNQTHPAVKVYSPEGTELASIPTPEIPTNVAFGRGEESYILYITAGVSLYKIQATQTGYYLPLQSEASFSKLK